MTPARCVTAVRLATDAAIRGPLWAWPPLLVKNVLSERRRRFGIEDERIDPADLTEGDTDIRVSED